MKLTPKINSKKLKKVDFGKNKTNIGDHSAEYFVYKTGSSEILIVT